MELKRSPLAPASFPKMPQIEGMRSATHRLGMYKGTRDDLLVVHFPEPVSCGGVFTRSTTRSADVDWCREALSASGGKASGLVVNAGNSNAFTFEAGVAKNEATLKSFAELTKTPRNTVYLAATGVIGEPVEAQLIAKPLPEVWEKCTEETNWLALASAFMTTDTFPKGAARSIKVGEKTINVCGIAKGSGMIAPNMATMLAYVFTDADLSPKDTQAILSRSVDNTFNCITVDGDTSTSDTVMLFATGKSHVAPTSEHDLALIEEAIEGVCRDLAHQIVRDGEGATKFVEIIVKGAESDTSAKIIASAIANSPLVKTALAASDANWGRVVMAVGKSAEPIDRDKLSIWFGNHLVAVSGGRAPDYSEYEATKTVSGDNIKITVDAAVGEGSATVWTCDLTHGYVEINGAYRT